MMALGQEFDPDRLLGGVAEEGVGGQGARVPGQQRGGQDERDSGRGKTGHDRLRAGKPGYQGWPDI